MAKLTPEKEKKKRELFEAMSPRSQKRIIKKGYDNWDPFMLPKEPPMYKLKQQAKGEEVSIDSGHELHERYFAERRITDYSVEYVKGVMEISQGLYREVDRYQGMYDFCLWYSSWRQRQEEGNE
ncbi:MAG: hypothetical protein JRJ12_12570 [Deltaproteobacteria bacterium]|nr:hypothetical protein [Deltaproteobacteria bacterium]MBW2071800.1 hypothetical protein [Deltaproteobacteria bacterium]